MQKNLIALNFLPLDRSPTVNKWYCCLCHFFGLVWSSVLPSCFRRSADRQFLNWGMPFWLKNLPIEILFINVCRVLIAMFKAPWDQRMKHFCKSSNKSWQIVYHFAYFYGLDYLSILKLYTIGYGGKIVRLNIIV